MPSDPDQSNTLDGSAEMDALVDSMETAHPGAVFGIYVFDPTTGNAYRRNADRVFHAASTMKVPVMIEVYRRAALGHFLMSDSLVVHNEFSSIMDGSPYSLSIEDDTDDVVYARIGEPMALEDLVRHMITRSSNLATNILIDYIGAEDVQRTVRNLGATTMEVLRGVEDIKAFEAGRSNTATAHDLGLLMRRIESGSAVSPDVDAVMLDVLKAQELNDMIPAGLPDGVEVAHKTGFITGINHDTAIVAPGENAYVLVILTEGVAEREASSRLGAEVAAKVHGLLRGA